MNNEMGKPKVLRWEPIKSEIPKIKIDPQGKVRVTRSRFGNLYFTGRFLMYPEANVICEYFGAGETVKWAFNYCEVHYILNGEADMSYSLYHTGHTEVKTMKVEKGDAYIIPSGAFVEWKVSNKGHLMKLCVIMPGMPPGEPAPGTFETLTRQEKV